MLKVLFAMILLTQLTFAQAEEETLSSEAYLAISEILKENGIDEKDWFSFQIQGKKRVESLRNVLAVSAVKDGYLT